MLVKREIKTIINLASSAGFQISATNIHGDLQSLYIVGEFGDTKSIQGLISKNKNERVSEDYKTTKFFCTANSISSILSNSKLTKDIFYKYKMRYGCIFPKTKLKLSIDEIEYIVSPDSFAYYLIMNFFFEKILSVEAKVNTNGEPERFLANSWEELENEIFILAKDNLTLKDLISDIPDNYSFEELLKQLIYICRGTIFHIITNFACSKEDKYIKYIGKCESLQDFWNKYIDDICLRLLILEKEGMFKNNVSAEAVTKYLYGTHGFEKNIDAIERYLDVAEEKLENLIQELSND